MGGKRITLPAPRKSSARSRTSAEPHDPLDRVETHLVRTLELVEAAIQRGDASPATVRESANVARAIVGVSAERRARVKQERVRFEHLTIADIARWLRGADGETRARIVRELQGIDARRGGVLG